MIKKTIILILLLLLSIENANAKISDALFAIVGNRVITQSDIVNEIKMILIVNNMSYSDDKREQLQQRAIKSLINRNIKQIAISNNDFLEYNKADLATELEQIAIRIGLDIETFKDLCSSNGLDFGLLEKKVLVELLWNSLIFQLYKNRLSINSDEIEEQLKLLNTKDVFIEYLVSEIVLKPIPDSSLNSEIKKIKERIENEGFTKVAMDLSISETAIKGGDLGWLSENIISKKFQEVISSTVLGNISEPILFPNGIIIFKVRDKRTVEKEINLEEAKNQLVNAEKSKILNMFSFSHYDSLRRSIPVKFNDDK